MTRKDYKRIASILQGNGIESTQDLAEDLMDFFKEDNPNFDRDKFRQAVDND